MHFLGVKAPSAIRTHIIWYDTLHQCVYRQERASLLTVNNRNIKKFEWSWTQHDDGSEPASELDFLHMGLSHYVYTDVYMDVFLQESHLRSVRAREHQQDNSMGETTPYNNTQ